MICRGLSKRVLHRIGAVEFVKTRQSPMNQGQRTAELRFTGGKFLGRGRRRDGSGWAAHGVERMDPGGSRGHSGIVPCFFGGRVSRLVRVFRSARQIVARVSDGSMTAVIIALAAAS